MIYDDIEQETQAKGLTAPRVTPQDVEGAIVSEHYFTATDGRLGAISAGMYAGREAPQPHDADLVPLSLLTFCVLVLRNGFTVTGESASPSLASRPAPARKTSTPSSAARSRASRRSRSSGPCWATPCASGCIAEVNK